MDKLIQALTHIRRYCRNRGDFTIQGDRLMVGDLRMKEAMPAGVRQEIADAGFVENEDCNCWEVYD